jgi:glutamate synthase domain-containing protein 2
MIKDVLSYGLGTLTALVLAALLVFVFIRDITTERLTELAKSVKAFEIKLSQGAKPGKGGSGAAPQALADHMGLSIEEALPRVVDALIESGLKARVRVVASGNMLYPYPELKARMKVA